MNQTRSQYIQSCVYYEDIIEDDEIGGNGTHGAGDREAQAEAWIRCELLIVRGKLESNIHWLDLTFHYL